MSILVRVSSPQRGRIHATSSQFYAKELNLTMSWGSAPGRATITYLHNPEQAAVPSGAEVSIVADGRTFTGICLRDQLSVGGTQGQLRHIDWVDTREYLKWDHIYAMFNMQYHTDASNVLMRSWWSMLPEHAHVSRRTYLPKPMSALDIVRACLGFTRRRYPRLYTVETTFHAEFHPSMHTPVLGLDWSKGRTLAECLQEISDKLGLVFTLDHSRGAYFLVWARKGEGQLPTFGASGVYPPDSDGRQLDDNFSGHPTRIRVLGDRNAYQVLNVPVVPDWLRAWQVFLDPFDFVRDIYLRGRDVNGVRFIVAAENDPDNLIGWHKAGALARTISVAEYAKLRRLVPLEGEAEAAAASWVDIRSYQGRSRAEMPAWLYITQIVWRAFRPKDFRFRNAVNYDVALADMEVEDGLLAAVEHNPQTGVMSWRRDLPVAGQGYAVVKGYNVGSDAFRMADPDRFQLSEWINYQNLWTHVGFQLDRQPAGPPALLFDEPIIRSADFFIEVDGKAVLKANPTLTVPEVRACLVFRAETFSIVRGRGGRDGREYVAGLFGQFVASAHQNVIEEIRFRDGKSVEQKAEAIASSILATPWVYAGGGYTIKGSRQTKLSGMYDRVTLNVSSSGVTETVDFTKERGSDVFQPERDLDRALRSQSLLPNEDRLQQEARELRLLASALRGGGSVLRSLYDVFHAGDVTRLAGASTGDTLPVGVPLWKRPTVSGSGGAPAQETLPAYDPDDSHTIFSGITIRDGEKATHAVRVVQAGIVPCRVRGPVEANDALGKGAGDYLEAGGTPQVAVALQAIASDEVKLISVRLGGSGSASTGEARWA